MRSFLVQDTIRSALIAGLWARTVVPGPWGHVSLKVRQIRSFELEAIGPCTFYPEGAKVTNDVKGEIWISRESGLEITSAGAFS